jgi:hypothetical protein
MEQQKDAGGEWREIARFPRLEDVRLDEQGQWRRLAYDIDAHTPEYRWLCPSRLRALVEEPQGLAPEMNTPDATHGRSRLRKI